MVHRVTSLLRSRSPFDNNRTADLIAITKHGPIFTSGTRFAEHGSFANDDRNVALPVAIPSLPYRIIDAEVETRQIAPTILEASASIPTNGRACARSTRGRFRASASTASARPGARPGKVCSGFPKRSRANNKPKRDGGLTKSHRALAQQPIRRRGVRQSGAAFGFCDIPFIPSPKKIV